MKLNKYQKEMIKRIGNGEKFLKIHRSAGKNILLKLWKERCQKLNIQCTIKEIEEHINDIT